MNEKYDSSSDGAFQGKPVEVTMSIDASRDTVFDAFIIGGQVKQWWGPKGFTSPEFKTDPRIGGRYLGCMKSPNGKEFWSTGSYIEISAPGRLKYSDSFADKNGNVVPATYYNMSKDFPLECVVDITLVEQDGGTKLSLKHYGIPKETLAECTTGWKECLDKLKTFVERPSEFQSARTQIAPSKADVNQLI